MAALGTNGLVKRHQDEAPFQRVIVEKPFGRDFESAKGLNNALLEHLAEEQLYRIDHYLGKETVQNILMFRFANPIFEPAWNSTYIDQVQITVAESLGVEHRAGGIRVCTGEKTGCKRRGGYLLRRCKILRARELTWAAIRTDWRRIRLAAGVRSHGIGGLQRMADSGLPHSRK
ncbi:MAG TPA: hypothetical protein DEQ20_09430 [Desulfobulbaceae bacterium]|nr:hypothetical protein [Desulfobulbaceae bacterium]